jgi:hypothetical protein
MAMRIIAVLVALAIFGSASAFAQSYDEELRFYPPFPTDKNEITAIVSLTTGTPCDKVELQDYDLDGNNLSINAQIIPPSSDILCVQMITQHMLEQNIGKLGAGTYSAQLYVNGVPRAKATLNVSTSDVAILSTGKYTDDQGGVNLVGEVQNAANHPVKHVGIGISFFKDDALVKEEQIYTTMAMIMPNRTSGFSLGLSDDLRDKEYSASVTSFSVEDRPVEKGLTLVVESALDRDGYGVVGGHVLNRADHNATQVKIVCAIYDIKGNVIDSIFGYTDPDTIPPEQTARFNIFTHSKISQEFTTSCNTESVELAVEQVQVIPEFPAIAAIAAASLAAVVAVNRLRHKL